MSKKQQSTVGDFILEQEPSLNKIKVSHNSGHFNFRLFVPNTPEFFKVWTSSEHSRAYEMIFSSIMLFVNFALTNAIYFVEWMTWHNQFVERMRAEVKEASDAEHDEALAEVKDDFEMAEKANITLATEPEVVPFEVVEADGIGFETARNSNLE